ncbi:hypothetical protein D3C75_984430 [compost metagenome]
MVIVHTLAIQVQRWLVCVTAQALIQPFDQRDAGLAQQLGGSRLVETMNKCQLFKPT